MVASRQKEIPFYGVVGRQSGRGFGALAQVIARTALPFSRKFIVPAAKRVGALLLQFAVPKIADFVSCRRTFKTAAKSEGIQTLRKELGNGSTKKSASRVIPTKSTKHTSRS